MQNERQAMRSEEQIVVFQLGHESYGVDISLVQEIKTMAPITRMPECPDYVDGVLNFRGQVTPVVNMRVRFGMQRAEPTKDTRIIVVGSRSQPVGLLVDSVSEVLRLPAELVAPPPPLLCEGRESAVRGIARVGEERLIILLELSEVLKSVGELLPAAA